jgi:hypothetical protein
MTTGTVLAFIVTSAIMLMAFVGGIWLETQMPDPQQQRFGPVHQPDLAAKAVAGQRINRYGPAWDEPRTRGRHRRPAGVP